MKKIFICISAVAVIFITSKVIYSEQYGVKTYGGNDRDEARSIKQTSDGGYILAGHTRSFGAGDWDRWILKLDDTLNVSWQKTYGGTSDDRAFIISETTDGGYILGGSTQSFGAGDYDVWIHKLDSKGMVIWQKTFGGSNSDVCTSIMETMDGGYILGGGTQSFGAGDRDIWILKLNNNGDITWQKTYGGTDWDSGEVHQTSDGGYVVAGSTKSFGAGNWDVWVLKLDNSGELSWQKTYGGSGSDNARTIDKTLDGGYIVAGETGSFGVGIDFMVLKLDSYGEISWQKAYGSDNADRAFAIKETADGSYIVAGDTDPFGVGNDDFLVFKLDNYGEILWQRTYGNNILVYNTSIDLTQDMGFVIAGAKASDSSHFDSYVLKVQSNGEIPFCDMMGITNAFLSDTSVEVQNTNATVQISSASVINTTITPQNAMADVSIVCCYDTDDFYPPPGGNGIGDACDCEGNFDCDTDCDGTDAATFKVDFGRSTFGNPCEDGDPCNGDFDCDHDCDGTDAAKFKVDFGRSSFNNPCPACVVGMWCVYE